MRKPNAIWQLLIGLKDALKYFWLKNWWEWMQMRKMYPTCICPMDVYLFECPEHGDDVKFYGALAKGPTPRDGGGKKSAISEEAGRH